MGIIGYTQGVSRPPNPASMARKRTPHRDFLVGEVEPVCTPCSPIVSSDSPLWLTNSSIRCYELFRRFVADVLAESAGTVFDRPASAVL